MIEEAEEPGEEVLRLRRDPSEAPAKAEPVARLPTPPAPEIPTRLDAGKPAEERRSHQPDIDVIIDGHEESADPEKEWSGKRQPVPYGWFVLIAILVGLAVAGSIMVGRPEAPTEAELAQETAVGRAETAEVETRDARALVEAVEQRITAYLAAGDIEALLPHVRHAERVAPLMERWYARHDFKPVRFEQLVVFEPVNIGTRSFWRALVSVTGPDGAKEELAPIVLEQTGRRSALIDWETSVCYQPMDWDDYVTERPEGTSMDFRVVCAYDPAGLYSHEFQDEREWRCFRLTTRDGDEYAFGYVRRESELESRLYDLFQQNRGVPPSLLLRLSRPQGTLSPRGVIIEEIVSPHWVIVDES